jgi:hypothetical protein
MKENPHKMTAPNAGQDKIFSPLSQKTPFFKHKWIRFSLIFSAVKKFSSF